MQTLVWKEFAQATIIMVSHRLDTLLDFDRVVVVDKGAIIEDRSP